MNTDSLHVEQKKRVSCLYRVSTAKQVNGDDIPLQRIACHKYINNYPEWVLVNEYYEKGVSGFCLSVESRDVLQNVISDAKEGKFDILLIFDSDRLCRVAIEYIEILEILSQYVSIHTVVQGDITIRSCIDSTRSYIDGWQNECESQKISMRIDSKHRQMAEEGGFHGGSAPFGYKLVLSGRYNEKDVKQRKEMYDLVIDKEESEIIQLIFSLAYKYGYGQNKIAHYLNEAKYKTRSGENWRATTINYILRNPIYKGYPAYGKKTCKKRIDSKKQTQKNLSEEEWILPKSKIDKLVIVPEEVWNKVRDMRKGRAHKGASETINDKNKVKLLFVGIIKCGHCGSPLVTTYHDKSWISKDGTLHTKRTIKYRCTGKQTACKDCDGNTTYAQSRIEKPIVQYIKDQLVNFNQYDISEHYLKEKNDIIKKYRKELAALEKSKESLYELIITYEDSLLKSFRGDGDYSAEQLNSLINKANGDLKDIKDKIENMSEEIKRMEKKVEDISCLLRDLPRWSQIFDNADIDRQKLMLSRIIKEIRIFKDHYEIDLKPHIKQFLNSISPDSNTIENLSLEQIASRKGGVLYAT